MTIIKDVIHKFLDRIQFHRPAWIARKSENKVFLHALEEIKWFGNMAHSLLYHNTLAKN
jgi:hypothetical protein